MTKRVFPLLLIICLTCSCTLYNVSSEDITTDYYPSKESPNAVVYIENIDQPHEGVASITVNAERRQRMSEILEKIKREAAVLGADAITNLKTDATGAWKQLPAQEVIGNGYVRANFSASGVVFK